MNSKTFEHLHPTMIYPLHQTLRKADTYAVILDVARHRKSEKVIGYRAEFISLTNLDPKEGTLFTADLPNWKPDTLPTGAGSKAVVSDALTILEQDKLKLTEEKAALEAELTTVREQRDTAIAEMQRASLGASQLRVELTEIEDIMKGWHQREGVDLALRVGLVREAYENMKFGSEQQKAEIDRLQFELGWMKAVEEARRSSEPKVEIKTLQHIIGIPEARLKSDIELAEHINDGWEKWDCAVEDGERIVTLARTCYPVPAPQPERTAAADQPQSVLVLVEDPRPAQMAVEEADLIEARADAAEKTSPLPRFTRQGFMKDAWEASMNAAAQVVQNRNPAYDAIFNRPNALPAVAVRPS